MPYLDRDGYSRYPYGAPGYDASGYPYGAGLTSTANILPRTSVTAGRLPDVLLRGHEEPHGVPRSYYCGSDACPSHVRSDQYCDPCACGADANPGHACARPVTRPISDDAAGCDFCAESRQYDNRYAKALIRWHRANGHVHAYVSSGDERWTGVHRLEESMDRSLGLDSRRRSDVVLQPAEAKAADIRGRYNIDEPGWGERPVTIYLSGPMTGHADWNFPAFNKAASELRQQGYAVMNPAETDNGDASKPRSYYMRKDVIMVAESDMVCVLPGWETSRGAKLEVAIAHELEMPVLIYPRMTPLAPTTTS